MCLLSFINQQKTSFLSIHWFWYFSFLFPKIAPDHVVPAPEECYVYSPLGSAYKLKSYTEGYGKNTSLVTMWVNYLLEHELNCVNEDNWLFTSVLIKMLEEPDLIVFLLLLFQFYDLEYHDGNIYTKYSLGHKTGNITFEYTFI